MYEFFHGLFENQLGGISSFFAWIGGILGSLFNGFKNILVALFEPILILVDGLYYLITQCFGIVVLVVQIIFGLFKVLGGVIAGAYNTFAQLLNYSGSTDYYYMPGAYRQGWDVVTNFMDSTGISTIALIMAVFIWMATAYVVIRIAGGER